MEFPDLVQIQAMRGQWIAIPTPCLTRSALFSSLPDVIHSLLSSSIFARLLLSLVVYDGITLLRQVT